MHCAASSAVTAITNHPVDINSCRFDLVIANQDFAENPGPWIKWPDLFAYCAVVFLSRKLKRVRTDLQDSPAAFVSVG